MKHKYYKYKKKTSVATSLIPTIAVLMGILVIQKEFHVLPKMDDSAFWVLRLFITLAILAIILKVIPKILMKQKYRKSGMQEIDRMKGNEFEKFLGVYFKDLGYKQLVHKGGPGDKGADLILRDPQGIKVVVQAKRYSGKVPFEAVQQIHTARSLYEANRAILITNYYLTKQATETASQLNIEVWNRKKLIENMYVYRKEKKVM